MSFFKNILSVGCITEAIKTATTALVKLEKKFYETEFYANQSNIAQWLNEKASAYPPALPQEGFKTAFQKQYSNTHNDIQQTYEAISSSECGKTIASYFDPKQYSIINAEKLIVLAASGAVQGIIKNCLNNKGITQNALDGIITAYYFKMVSNLYPEKTPGLVSVALIAKSAIDKQDICIGAETVAANLGTGMIIEYNSAISGEVASYITNSLNLQDSIYGDLIQKILCSSSSGIPSFLFTKGNMTQAALTSLGGCAKAMMIYCNDLCLEWASQDNIDEQHPNIIENVE